MLCLHAVTSITLLQSSFLRSLDPFLSCSPPAPQRLMLAQYFHYPTPFKLRSPLFPAHPPPSTSTSLFSTPIYLSPAFSKATGWNFSSPLLPVCDERRTQHCGVQFWCHQGLKPNTTSALRASLVCSEMRKILQQKLLQCRTWETASDLNGLDKSFHSAKKPERTLRVPTHLSSVWSPSVRSHKWWASAGGAQRRN